MMKLHNEKAIKNGKNQTRKPGCELKGRLNLGFGFEKVQVPGFSGSVKPRLQTLRPILILLYNDRVFVCHSLSTGRTGPSATLLQSSPDAKHVT